MGDQMSQIETGSVALVFEEKRDDYLLKVEFVGWKGKNSLRAYVPKGERIHSRNVEPKVGRETVIVNVKKPKKRQKTVTKKMVMKATIKHKMKRKQLRSKTQKTNQWTRSRPKIWFTTQIIQTKAQDDRWRKY